MFTKEQQKEFVEFYISLYWDTSKETGTWELPHIKANEKEKHIKMRKDKLTEIIWPKKSKRSYIHKWWRKDTRLWRIFEELWLCYWPIVDLDNNK